VREPRLIWLRHHWVGAAGPWRDGQVVIRLRRFTHFTHFSPQQFANNLLATFANIAREPLLEVTSGKENAR